MEHPDPDELTLLALDEPATPASSAHLARCRKCADEVTEFRRIVQRAKEAEALALDVPAAPERVWKRIRALSGTRAVARRRGRPLARSRRRGCG